MKLDYQGMAVFTRQQIMYQQRRQAIEDFPLLKQIHRLLKTRSGKRMARWDKLAFAAELLIMGYSTNKAAAAAEITKPTCFRLRDRLKDGGILPRDWKPVQRKFPMTDRQRECRQLMSSGMGCRRIARALGITSESAKALMRRTKSQLERL